MKTLKKRAFCIISLAALAATALLLVIPNTGAQGGSNVFADSNICHLGLGSNIFGTIGSATPLNSMVEDSLLIVLFLVNIAVIAYILGNAFRIRSLANFGRAEMGEAVITIVIVAVFLGTFQGITFNPIFNNQALAPSSNFFAPTPSAVQPSTFLVDCNMLVAASGVAFNNAFGVLAFQDFDELVQSFSYSINFGGGTLGYSASPYAGLSGAIFAIDQVSNIAFVLVAFPLAVAGLLWIFFAFFPIFFYIGLVMRAFPWTRAAGASFLGIFLGFYLMFPALLFLLLSGLGQTAINPYGYSAIQTISYVNPIDILGLGVSYLLGDQALLQFIGISNGFGGQGEISQLFFILVAVLLSFIISFDFMEAISNLLGAPSLRADNTLRRVI